MREQREKIKPVTYHRASVIIELGKCVFQNTFFTLILKSLLFRQQLAPTFILGVRNILPSAGLHAICMVGDVQFENPLILGAEAHQKQEELG